MNKIFTCLAMALLLIGCGTTTVIEKAPEAVEETPQSTLKALLTNGVQVNIINVINGTWNVTDFPLTDINAQPTTMSGNPHDDDIQFINGDLNTLSMPPLYDYHEVLYEGAPNPPNAERCTEMPLGEIYVTDAGDSFEYFEADFWYEIIDTGYEPIIQFILTGTQYQMCGVDYGTCNPTDHPECFGPEFRTKVLGYVIRGAANNAFVIETGRHYVLFERANNP